ncbi:hypothetical protein DY000_02027575 [Brassica cretica]|uniref:Phorbol-ester/DAG-type domain-containing protein n=1 Tax=Brassica cretica TaxID=69181 RepID=A0ABQ7EF43_BRACR|nr:hypothetical protein DY000_02027575 [Brassica cretica]
MNRIKLPTHKHPLYPTPWVRSCSGCYRENDCTKDGYRCYECEIFFHKKCAESSVEINHPSHPEHPLHLSIPENFSESKNCKLCGETLIYMFYHCPLCKFVVDTSCIKNPPPDVIDHPKAHEHSLVHLKHYYHGTCDFCEEIYCSRYLFKCFQCQLKFHLECSNLPLEIIHPSHSKHPLKRLQLSPGSWICGICHKKVDWSCGAYSCSICPDYAIHSRCALRDDVWDKLELKGIPEEPQEIKPYTVVNGNLIRHFSHEEHYLQLNEENIICGGSIRCEACVLPIYSQAFYSCVQCDFILHKTCANLPRKKRHMYHAKPLTLVVGDMTYFDCSACSNRSSGFRYSITNFNIDVKCSALSESIFHESHGCTLYYIYGNRKHCIACGNWSYSTFNCDDCKFVLDLKCVVLPKTTGHWYDEHILSLCYENPTKGEHWCDICEESIEKNWFYNCDICCVAFHTKCVLGDFSLLMPGRVITYYGKTRFEVIQTHPGFLPRCYICPSRRAVPFVSKVLYPKKNVYICSSKCFLSADYVCKDLY